MIKNNRALVDIEVEAFRKGEISLKKGGVPPSKNIRNPRVFSTGAPFDVVKKKSESEENDVPCEMGREV